MDVKWHLRRIEKETDTDGIIKLRQKCFHNEDLDKEKKDFWEWEFKDNYAGDAKIFLAEDDGRIVGHYAVCPATVVVNGEEKSGSIVVDVMTDPEYRKQGMFTAIGRYALSESGGDGVDFSYGFPIRKSVMPGHLKVGWKVAFPLPVYVYPVSFYKLIKKFIKLRSLSLILSVIPSCFTLLKSYIGEMGKKGCIEESGHLDKSEEMIRFLNEINKQYSIIQRRDYKFLDWRFNKNKYRKYKHITVHEDGRVVGYAIVRTSEIFGLRCLILMDIHVLNYNKHIVKVLLNKLNKIASTENCALVGCMINNNKYKNILLRYGYLKTPYIFKFILHSNREINYECDLLDNKKWYLTWTDTDDL